MTETTDISTSIQQDDTNNKKCKIITAIRNEYTRTKQNINKFMIDNKLYDNIDEIVNYLMAHPVLLTICISTIFTLMIPVLLFIIFAVINIAFAFTGFIIVIVAVVTVGATVLCSILFTIIVTLAIIGISLVLTWFLSCYIISAMKNFKIIP